jgi:glutaminyl-tRNA synthetase
MTEVESPKVVSNFIRDIINKDLESGKHKGIITRFPPEPNGYLHIGHAKSIFLNFSLAKEYGGICHLRFDDTNPSKEEQEFVDSIINDVKWLGFDWQDKLFFASDYFDEMYRFATELIKNGKAYVCSLSAEETRDYRGTLTKPGRNSPYRERSVEENIKLFEGMKVGEFDEGAHVLRAKIDMASPNMNMRDPAIYRILKRSHHRSADKWNIYPMYDFAHCLEDALEKITHSICTLEFEDHRPLYDWVLDNITIDCHPQQIEFARLELTYCVLSKRKLSELVSKGYVTSWDDPRMPTLAGMRRRGFTSEAICRFCESVGVAKANSVVDIAQFHFFVRDDLNKRANRVMAVLDPIKVIITNYPEGKTEMLDAVNNPEDPNAGERQIPFSREIYVERADFREEANSKYRRLAPGKEVRLQHAYYVTCNDFVKDEQGEVVEIHCSYDPETRGGWSEDGRKVKGTIHWVSCEHAIDADVRLYDHLFKVPNPNKYPEGEDYQYNLNEDSLIVLENCKLEPSLAEAKAGISYQFLRQGYYCVDEKDSSSDKIVINRTISLRDTWAKIEKS